MALELVGRTYEVSGKLPKTELYGLAEQMKRAAVSVVLNIAEGRAADSEAEFRRFLGISLRSLVEVVACFKVCASLGFLPKDAVQEVLSPCDKLEAKLRSFRSALR